MGCWSPGLRSGPRQTRAGVCLPTATAWREGSRLWAAQMRQAWKMCHWGWSSCFWETLERVAAPGASPHPRRHLPISEHAAAVCEAAQGTGLRPADTGSD